MTAEQKAAYITAQAAVLNATVAGMVAENEQRKVLGYSMAYTEEAFVKEVERSGCCHNAVMRLFEEQP